MTGCQSNYFEYKNPQNFFSFHECNSTQLILFNQIKTNFLVHFRVLCPLKFLRKLLLYRLIINAKTSLQSGWDRDSQAKKGGINGKKCAGKRDLRSLLGTLYSSCILIRVLSWRSLHFKIISTDMPPVIHIPSCQKHYLRTLKKILSSKLGEFRRSLSFSNTNTALEDTMRFSRFQINGRVLIFFMSGDANRRITWYVYSEWDQWNWTSCVLKDLQIRFRVALSRNGQQAP